MLVSRYRYSRRENVVGHVQLIVSSVYSQGCTVLKEKKEIS